VTHFSSRAAENRLALAPRVNPICCISIYRCRSMYRYRSRSCTWWVTHFSSRAAERPASFGACQSEPSARTSVDSPAASTIMSLRSERKNDMSIAFRYMHWVITLRADQFIAYPYMHMCISTTAKTSTRRSTLYDCNEGPTCPKNINICTGL